MVDKKTIPRILHSIWVGDKPKPIKLMQTWKDKHPDYKFFEWNNETVRKMKFRCQKQIDQMWGVGRFNGVADLIRYEVLYEFGGFVAPADSVCLNPIDDLLEYGMGFCCYENEKVRPDLLSPHLGVAAGNFYFDVMIKGLMKTVDVLYADPWITTGNKFLTDAVKLTGYPIKILPSYTFIPEHYTGEIYAGNGKIYAKHFWGGTKGIINNLDDQLILNK